jgi:hypothetical protein
LASTPRRKVSHSSRANIRTGRPGALSLLWRTPTLSPSWATSTQWPFAALQELFFQRGPADPSVPATAIPLQSWDHSRTWALPGRRQDPPWQPLLLLICSHCSVRSTPGSGPTRHGTQRGQELCCAMIARAPGAARRETKMSSGIYRASAGGREGRAAPAPRPPAAARGRPRPGRPGRMTGPRTAHAVSRARRPDGSHRVRRSPPGAPGPERVSARFR